MDKRVPVDPTVVELAEFAAKLPEGTLPYTLGLTTVRSFYQGLYNALPDRKEKRDVE